MPNIRFLPDDITIQAETGTLLSRAAETAGVTISLPCAGKGICGKCLVKIESGKVNFENPGILSESLESDGYVLACRSKVAEEDVTVHATSGVDEEEGSFADAFSHLGIDDALLPQKNDISPMISCVEVTVAQPEMLDGLSDLDRFTNAAQETLGMEVCVPLGLLRILPNILRAREGKIFLWYREVNGRVSVVDISVEQTKNYGVAVDIGTTTVAVQLVDMETAHVLDSVTSYNAQIDRGVDVISRISYAKNAERIEEMRQLILKTINESITELSKRQRIELRSIYSMAVAANTTMVELLLGITPDYIRLEPYTPAVLKSPLYTAGEVGFVINPYAPVRIAPNVGSYVGGDITSGLLCTEISLDAEELCLFIDIGTNGEIVFGNNDFLLSCACSAGPAFEGGGIEKGMRASVGAIETVEIDPQTGVAKYAVIGGGQAKGICGSGLISLVAQLFEAKIIDPGGKFDTSGKFPAVVAQGRQARYDIVPSDNEVDRVYITEADIDNLIRAKAAIFSACLVLLKSVEMDFDSLSKIYIAGGFGRYIDVNKAQAIGLLPDLPIESFEFIGNSSLAGAFMTLVSARHREKEIELASKITYIDLSTEASYMDEYVSAMFLPHTDERLFSRRK